MLFPVAGESAEMDSAVHHRKSANYPLEDGRGAANSFCGVVGLNSCLGSKSYPSYQVQSCFSYFVIYSSN